MLCPYQLPPHARRAGRGAWTAGVPRTSTPSSPCSGTSTSLQSLTTQAGRSAPPQMLAWHQHPPAAPGSPPPPPAASTSTPAVPAGRTARRSPSLMAAPPALH
eukprot:2015385-Rhodomonas_salina.1